MITDDELALLPEEPELAFVEFERIMRASVDEQELNEQRLADEGVGDIADPYRRECLSKVLAAARVYGVAGFDGWRVPAAMDDVRTAYIGFTADADHVTTQIRLRYAPRNRQNSVALDGNTKAKIHHFIEQIRAIIENADPPEPKKDSLYTKLNAFALEVDKNRTNLQSGMAIYIAVCDGIGQGLQKLEPARKWIDSIGALLGRAKEVEDSLRPALPRPQERRRLEPPRPSEWLDIDPDLPREQEEEDR